LVPNGKLLSNGITAESFLSACKECYSLIYKLVTETPLLRKVEGGYESLDERQKISDL